MRYHHTLVRMVIIKRSTNNKCWRGCGEKGTLLHYWWECKLVQPLWRTVWRFLKQLKTELPYDPAIPLLGIYPEKTKTLIQKDTYTPMFIAAWFTIAKTWKEPRCPLTEELVKKMWYIYNGILLSDKKEWNNAICSDMDGDYHTKWGKSDREIQISCDITYILNLKKWDKWTSLQNRNRLTDFENKLMVTKGETWWGGIN